MPLRPEPYDKEYMNHPAGTPALGRHYTDAVCSEFTELRHDHPALGEGNRWTCTREEGHMGRHEAGVVKTLPDGRHEIVASWARK